MLHFLLSFSSRKLDSNVMQYRIASVNDYYSSLAATPGGSSKVFDVDSPSPSNNTRQDMIVKIRTRGGIQKFTMQMVGEMYAILLLKENFDPP